MVSSTQKFEDPNIQSSQINAVPEITSAMKETANYQQFSTTSSPSKTLINQEASPKQTTPLALFKVTSPLTTEGHNVIDAKVMSPQDVNYSTVATPQGILKDIESPHYLTSSRRTIHLTPPPPISDPRNNRSLDNISPLAKKKKSSPSNRTSPKQIYDQISMSITPLKKIISQSPPTLPPERTINLDETTSPGEQNKKDLSEKQGYINSQKTIELNALAISIKTSNKVKSRSSQNKICPETIDSDEETQINENLGEKFYTDNPWLSKTKQQFSPNDRSKVIAAMGSLALNLEEQFPKWFCFLLPKVDDDRKNWTITVNDREFVSVSKAFKRPGLPYLNRNTKLELCPICDRIVTHKHLVIMKCFQWKDNFTKQDVVDWQDLDLQLRACYIHWRDESAKFTPERNPWKINSRTRYSKNSRTTAQALGPAVLPKSFI